MLEVRHLEIVRAIARAGTVTAAAERVHLTQPAVSRALADLEARLGVGLFRREPRGMALTDEGARLLRTAEAVLAEIREVEEELRLRKEGCQGVVRVTTECYTCYPWLPAVLAHFRERFPEVEVKIAPEATEDPLTALLEERVDLAVMHSPVEHAELLTEPLFVDELVAAVPPGHRLAGRGSVEPGDFADEVVLVHSEPGASPFFTEFLDPAGVRPQQVLELRLTEAVLASVKAGLGVTVMAHWALEDDLEAGRLVGLRLGRGLERGWRLVTRRDRARRATIQELARLLAEERVGISPEGAGPAEPPGG